MNIENQKLLEKNKLIDTYLKQINGLNEQIKKKNQSRKKNSKL